MNLHKIIITNDKHEGSKKVTLIEQKKFLGFYYWSHVRTYRGPKLFIIDIANKWQKMYKSLPTVDKTQPKLR